MARTKTSDLAELLKQIQTQLAELAERVEQLESAGPGKAAAKSAPVAPPVAAAEPKAVQPAPAPARPELTEEEMIAISAALAAYLGFRVRIRQIRLISSPAWAQQGRVSIQASHILH
jgi:methylmalonyl-CoA carboxyltransferase 12S subunit